MFCSRKLLNYYKSLESKVIVKYFSMDTVKNLKTRLLKGENGLPPIYSGEAPPSSDIRKYLSLFGGGMVNVHFYDDEIAIVTLNHIERKNAISGKMMVDLADVVERLESWGTGKGVILRGQDGNFCSGGDLNMARETNHADGGFQMATFMTEVLNRFQTLPLLTVALIEGFALGGGAEVSLACDFRLMNEGARIGFVHGRMGILPAWGGTGRLLRVVGYRQTLKILGQAKPYGSDEALQMTLIDQVIPTNAESLKFAVDWIKSTTQVSANVFRGIKTSCALLQANSQDQDWERRIFAPYWGCDENKQALSAKINHLSKQQ